MLGDRWHCPSKHLAASPSNRLNIDLACGCLSSTPRLVLLCAVLVFLEFWPPASTGLPTAAGKALQRTQAHLWRLCPLEIDGSPEGRVPHPQKELMKVELSHDHKRCEISTVGDQRRMLAKEPPCSANQHLFDLNPAILGSCFGVPILIRESPSHLQC